MELKNLRFLVSDIEKMDLLKSLADYGIFTVEDFQKHKDTLRILDSDSGADQQLLKYTYQGHAVNDALRLIGKGHADRDFQFECYGQTAYYIEPHQQRTLDGVEVVENKINAVKASIQRAEQLIIKKEAELVHLKKELSARKKAAREVQKKVESYNQASFLFHAEWWAKNKDRILDQLAAAKLENPLLKYDHLLPDGSGVERL